MPRKRSESAFRHALLGAILFAAFGIVLAGIGGRLVVYDHLLGDRAESVLATITGTGTTRSSSGHSSRYIRYRFVDAAGTERKGLTSGYSGVVGETVRVEYARGLSRIHRVAGSARMPGYRWRWAILGGGLLFLVAGTHWGVTTERRRRLARRLVRRGRRIEGEIARISQDRRSIEYRYRAGGAEHRGRSTALARERTTDLSDGDPTTVVYDPAAPDRSVLELEIG